MNNNKYKATMEKFFAYLDTTNEDNQNAFSDFLSNNGNTLVTHFSLFYGEELKLAYDNREPIYNDLEQWFFFKNPNYKFGSFFPEKMLLIEKSYPEIYFQLDVFTMLVHAHKYNSFSIIENFNIKTTELRDQQSKLKRQQDLISSNIEKQKMRITDQNRIINKQKDSLNKTVMKIDNIYSEFVSILGIFTAITFAIFGGMNLLTDLFKNIGSTPVSLGQTLILAAIFSLIMWGIIELLFYWISKIKGITNSTKDKDKVIFNFLAAIVIVWVLTLGILLFTKAIK